VQGCCECRALSPAPGLSLRVRLSLGQLLVGAVPGVGEGTPSHTAAPCQHIGPSGTRISMSMWGGVDGGVLGGRGGGKVGALHSRHAVMTFLCCCAWKTIEASAPQIAEVMRCRFIGHMVSPAFCGAGRK